MSDEITQLREKVSNLEEALACLRKDGGVYDADEFEFTPRQKSVFEQLRLNQVVTKDRIHYAIYSVMPGDPPDKKAIDVYICQVRKALKKDNKYWVETRFGEGWILRKGPEPEGLTICRRRPSDT